MEFNPTGLIHSPYKNKQEENKQMLSGINGLKRIFLSFLSLFLIIFLVVGCTDSKENTKAPDGDQELVYTVSDPTGDWGFPSPYAHYSRGPRLYQNELSF